VNSTLFEFSRQKTRHEIANKRHLSKYAKSKMMDFQHFEAVKSSVFAKFEFLKCQFFVKIERHLSGKIQIEFNLVQKD